MRHFCHSTANRAVQKKKVVDSTPNSCRLSSNYCQHQANAGMGGPRSVLLELLAFRVIPLSGFARILVPTISTPARTYCINNVCYRSSFPENYISYINNFFWQQFPIITLQSCVCDSDNYMENVFGNHSLGKPHFSYIKDCFQN